MRRATLPLLFAALFALGAVISGCGGGGGSGTAAATTRTTETERETETETETETTETEPTTSEFVDTTETIVGTSDAYKTGQAICGNNPLEILAQQWGVKATVEAVATAVSLQFTSAKDRADAKAGCLAALKAQ